MFKKLLLVPSLALFSVVLGPPPPTDFLASNAISGQDSAPEYATLFSPISGQRLYRNRPVKIKFSDPGTLATEIRFSLSNYTGLYLVGKSTLNNAHVDEQITLPEWVADGTYDFVVSENDGPFASDEYNMDVVICSIFVGPRKKKQMDFVSPFRNQAEGNGNFKTNTPIIQKREPHPPKFLSPVKNQVVRAGSQFQIRFLDGELDPTVNQAKFVLRPSTKPTQEFLLTGPGASKDGLYKFNGLAIEVNVTCPRNIPFGKYLLVAEEYYPESAKIYQSLASIDVQIHSQAADEQPDEEMQLLNRGSLRGRWPKPMPLENKAKSAFNTPNEKQVISNQASLLSPSRVITRPIQKRVTPSAPSSSPEVASSGPLKSCDQKSTDVKALQKRKDMDSTTMIQPYPNQAVAAGSKFVCKVEDPNATSETVHFVLRAFHGTSYDLGSTKFVKGVATFTAVCPHIPYDTYYVVACQNSIKKPKTFLDVVSTAILVTHAPSTQSAPLTSTPAASTASQLIKPVYNQYILPGQAFECQLQNGENAAQVKFLLRSDEAGPELSVGNCEIRQNLAKTMCQIPSSVIPGTYVFVARKNSKANPNRFSDADEVYITLANPRGFGPDAKNGMPNRLAARSLNSIESQQIITSHQRTQLSILVAPISYQTVFPGKSFEVKLKNNTSPQSSMLRFLLKPVATSLTNKQYILGTVSNGQSIQESLRCPEHIQSGTYLLVIQGNDPEDPESFTDSISTPLIVNSLSQSDSAMNNSNNDSLSRTSLTGLNPPSQQTQPLSSAQGSPNSTPVAPPATLTTLADGGDGEANAKPANGDVKPPSETIDRSSTPLGSGNYKNVFTSDARREIDRNHWRFDYEHHRLFKPFQITRFFGFLIFHLSICCFVFYFF